MSAQCPAYGRWRLKLHETYLSLDVFLLVLVIVGLHTHLELLDVLLLGVFVCRQSTRSWVSTTGQYKWEWAVKNRPKFRHDTTN